MDFEFSPRCQQLQKELLAFMDEHVYPAEPRYEEQMAALPDPHETPQVLEDLKAEARARGLWNLFLPHKTEWTDGLSNLDYAPLAEITGRVPFAAEALNCSAPDTGNMEILTMFGTEEQKEQWLGPLLRGEIRSAFAMTEPAVASSDATNIGCSVVRDGDEYVINGRKWWISGSADPRCRILIVMGKTDPDGERHRQQSMVLVPIDTPGVTVVRNLPVFGYVDREGHCEITFEDVRVPVGNLLGEEGGGFAIAQARLGPGRIHHCMRTIGVAERALERMVARAEGRVTFGQPVAERGQVQDWIANARMNIDQARLYTLYAAWKMDRDGNRAAATEIAAIKVAVPKMALEVIDRAIQVHGGGGVSDDFGLAWAYAHTRILQLADGPDEVHRRTVARREQRRLAVAR
ncbi:acyl-CoA dehydrogenase family protein [Nocardioides humi]|uniref:Acyl-CoA dehydrogenase family protein n=1 Tax=Nocardioides humi TaxID=449461 RepID=A0ABN2BVK2_9ACTN|nr:acyl-CoA dehydrogenase family protein [Nocardioides humi]